MLKNAITREEKRRNIKIEQSGLYPNQSGISGGGTKKWVIDKLVTDGTVTTFNDNAQVGNYIDHKDFIELKNAIKKLTQKTMDYSVDGSGLDAIDIGSGKLILAKDMALMQNLMVEMGKACVCNAKEVCACKEACATNCTCQGHCTCNTYESCGCNGYTPCTCNGPCTSYCSCNGPCTSQCSCKSYTCSCQGPCNSHCSCRTYTAPPSVSHGTVSSKVTVNGALSTSSRTANLASFFQGRKATLIGFTITYYQWLQGGTTILTDSYMNSFTNDPSAGASNIVFEPQSTVITINGSPRTYSHARKSSYSGPSYSNGMYFAQNQKIRYFSYSVPSCNLSIPANASNVDLKIYFTNLRVNGAMYFKFNGYIVHPLSKKFNTYCSFDMQYRLS